MNTYKCKASHLEYRKITNNSNKAIFILHGYGASMDDLYGLGSYLDPQGDYDWYFPNGPLKVDISHHVQGRAWFPIDMNDLQQAMMSGTFRSFADKQPENFFESIKAVNDFILSNSNDYQSIAIGGFSQGSMVTSHLLNISKKVKAYLCLSGTLLNEDALEKSVSQAEPIPFFQSHGKNDQVLEYAQAMNLFEFLKYHRLQGEFVSFDGGHEIPAPVLDKCKKFLVKIL